MKHCLYIHQDHQLPKPYLYLLDEISCKYRLIFRKFYMQSAIVKPCRMYFTRTF